MHYRILKTSKSGKMDQIIRFVQKDEYFYKLCIPDASFLSYTIQT